MILLCSSSHELRVEGETSYYLKENYQSLRIALTPSYHCLILLLHIFFSMSREKPLIILKLFLYGLTSVLFHYFTTFLCVRGIISYFYLTSYHSDLKWLHTNLLISHWNPIWCTLSTTYLNLTQTLIYYTDLLVHVSMTQTFYNLLWKSYSNLKFMSCCLTNSVNKNNSSAGPLYSGSA